ncbi:hypothetical protein AVEN_107394-1 [Araneus ventricosus]|uniref:Uncharacterized protein n=1 Tax=Araneus ventricosus TaxID=182803 RepID=A0A4Y2VUT1_ARAVE|nr:hypothetical protein AVEN_107394-1 [Araneus ventricosus]
MAETASLDYSPSFGTFRALLRSAVREKIEGHTYIHTYVCLPSNFNRVDDKSFYNGLSRIMCHSLRSRDTSCLTNRLFLCSSAFFGSSLLATVADWPGCQLARWQVGPLNIADIGPQDLCM